MAGELTTEVARILMSRKGLGSTSQNLLNIIGNAVGRAECGSKPANNSECHAGMAQAGVLCTALVFLGMACDSLVSQHACLG